ncbi:MAG: hypothetical protein A2W91_08405 [Bacteroidetes bacterium GWF2_38_335]|nr:MAG: hypothetical protein A2W91_08405 [Bacteroidetes bacterium GWF2_38_335]OFY78937.1 MAG: hypothetical protein A2281_02315 [Bacteroidetes bacterium RIFOXYA12_FULL_38_20]HBS86002.1 hypothetical protein [Bacteroidales bacterium]
MKKSLFTIAIATLFAGTILTGCQSSEDKIKNAEDNVKDAQDELEKAKNDSIAEYNSFKKASEEKIIAHAKILSDFKERIAEQKKENRADYEKKLAELEAQNSDLKMKLELYKEQGKNNWQQFKEDFNNEMEDLGKSISDLTDGAEN